MIPERLYIGNWRNIMKFDDIISIDPYSLDSSEKEKLLTEQIYLEKTEFFVQ